MHLVQTYTNVVMDDFGLDRHKFAGDYDYES